MFGLFKHTHRQEPGSFYRRRRAARAFDDRALRLEVEAMEARTLLTGTWLPLANLAPGNVDTMLLLTDGTVMAQDSGTRTWYELTPDPAKGYVGGTWHTVNPMNDIRADYASAVLPDGRVFVAGGEFGTGGSTAEIYDPLTNTWSYYPATTIWPNDPIMQATVIGDAPAKLLPDGDIILAPERPKPFGTQMTLLYDPATDTWLPGPNTYSDVNFKYPPNVTNRSANETSWVLLPYGSILTVDNASYAGADGTGTNGDYVSERYVPSLNQWVNDSPLPENLWHNGDTGPGVLLDDGRAFFLGASGYTALYTPAANPTQPGTWTPGPLMPAGLGASDTPAVVLSNGKVLCVVRPMSGDNGQTFLEYDPATNLFTPVANAPNFDLLGFTSRFLALPDGTALYSDTTDELYVYRPDGAPLAAAQPTITNIQRMPGGSFHLTGTQLNGLTEGAYYGDDAQMSTNYPIVELTDSAHNVYYAKTTNWSIGVATGNLPVSTDFTLPPGLSPGYYGLSVVANGVASSAVPFSYGPTIVNAAAANSSIVTGETTVLNVLGTDQASASPLMFNWTVTSGPIGASAPTFSTNGSSNAESTMVTFHHAGTYVFLVTLTDDLGFSASSRVQVVVTQSLNQITVNPSSARMYAGATLKLSALALDQFGNPLAGQPRFTWRVFGSGRVGTFGRFAAPKHPAITTVKAYYGSVSGSAEITTKAQGHRIHRPLTGRA